MDSYLYAQLNKDSICIGFSHLSGEVNAEGVVQLEKEDSSLVGKKYIDGKFVEMGLGNHEPQQELTNYEMSQQNMAIIEGLIDISEKLERLEGIL